MTPDNNSNLKQQRKYTSRNRIAALLSSNDTAEAHSKEKRQELLDHPAMVSAAKGCMFVKSVGRSLGFPSRTVCTAQLVIHRTYIHRPNLSTSSTDLAAACLLVAAKMEETIKRLGDVLAHSYYYSSTAVQSSLSGPQAVPTATAGKMRHSVLICEQQVLGALGFDFRTANPHMLYVKLAKLAGVSKDTVGKYGWTILNDSYFTTLPIQYPAVVMAVGSLCLAWHLDNSNNNRQTSQMLRDGIGGDGGSTAMPLSSATGSAPPSLPHNRPESLDMSAADWWLQLGVSAQDLKSFIRQIVDFYVLFFNSAVASAEYMARHKGGVPSKDMSQRIGQWRLELSGN